MQRFLFRVQYTDADGLVVYEPVSVRAESEAAARTDVDDATERYRVASGSTKTLTLIGIAADL